MKRLTKKILLTCSAITSFSPLCKQINDSIAVSENVQIKNEKILKKKEIKSCLLKEEESSFNETNNEIFYSFKTNSISTPEYIITTDLAAESNSTPKKYDIEYIKGLNLFCINSFDTSTSEKKNSAKRIYGFPYRTNDNELDVLFDVDGAQMSYSQTDSLLAATDFQKTEINQNIDGIDLSLYPLMKICTNIAIYDDANSLAKDLQVIPTILGDGPVQYIIYRAKIDKIVSDYNHNKELTQPTGIINDQGKYTNWNFGYSIKFNSDKSVDSVSEGNLSENGCGCIAMYNLLFDSGANPHLPTIIALTQLCNADLAFGLFGVNPVGEEAISLISSALIEILEVIVIKQLFYYVDEIADLLFNHYLTSCPWWVKAVLKFTAKAWVTAEVIKIKAALNKALKVAQYFVSAYLTSLSDFSKVISLFTKDKYSEVDCLTFQSFKDNLYAYRQGIFTFWNSTNDCSNIIDFINEGAHTVYVKKTLISSYTVYNYSNKTSKSFRFFSMYQNSDLVESPINHDFQYIYGYVWRQA